MKREGRGKRGETMRRGKNEEEKEKKEEGKEKNNEKREE